MSPEGFFEICNASGLYKNICSDWSTAQAILLGYTIDSLGLLIVLKQAGSSNLY